MSEISGIVVGVDESSPSQHALRWAHQFGKQHDVGLTAVMAWDYIGQHHVHADEPFDPRYSAATAQSVLQALVDRCLGAHNGVRTEVVLGKAGACLLEAASRAELIVVGARGLGGFRGLLLGSVSRHVVHHARIPVAIVRADPPPLDRPIVVGIDGSPASVRALEWAARQAATTKMAVLAIHAWHVPVIGSPYAAIMPDPLSAAQCAEEVLAHTIDAANVGDAAIERRTVRGSAAGELLAAADSVGASLLVVGASGLGGVAGALLGSVSGQVAQHATCPAVVVP